MPERRRREENAVTRRPFMVRPRCRTLRALSCSDPYEAYRLMAGAAEQPRTVVGVHVSEADAGDPH
jgi:hypothetical protein